MKLENGATPVNETNMLESTKCRARMKKAAPPPPASNLKSTVSNGNLSYEGPASMTTPGEDCAIDELLEGRMELEVVLPDSRKVKMTVDRRTPMMDLLVQAATANKISPGGHVINIISKDDSSIQYKPNTPIGSLDTNTVYIIPKASVDLPIKKMPKLANQPFEQQTFRLQVNLPLNQRMVLRVSPRATLAEIKRQICYERELDHSCHHLVHPAQPDVVLDLNTTLEIFGYAEISLMSNSGLRDSIRSTSTNLIAYPRVEEEKKRKGILRLFSRKKKGTPGDNSCNGINSRGVSPARSEISNKSNIHPKQSTKRKPAPAPPLPCHPPSSPLVIQGSSTTDSRPESEISTKIDEVGSTVSHSRHSSDSSGYHEPSVFSDCSENKSPETSIGNGGTLLPGPESPFRKDVTEFPMLSKKASTPAREPTNLKNVPSCSNVSIISTSRKRKAPQPPSTILPEADTSITPDVSPELPSPLPSTSEADVCAITEHAPVALQKTETNSSISVQKNEDNAAVSELNLPDSVEKESFKPSPPSTSPKPNTHLSSSSQHDGYEGELSREAFLAKLERILQSRQTADTPLEDELNLVLPDDDISHTFTIPSPSLPCSGYNNRIQEYEEQKEIISTSSGGITSSPLIKSSSVSRESTLTTNKHLSTPPVPRPRLSIKRRAPSPKEHNTPRRELTYDTAGDEDIRVSSSVHSVVEHPPEEFCNDASQLNAPNESIAERKLQPLLKDNLDNIRDEKDIQTVTMDLEINTKMLSKEEKMSSVLDVLPEIEPISDPCSEEESFKTALASSADKECNSESETSCSIGNAEEIPNLIQSVAVECDIENTSSQMDNKNTNKAQPHQNSILSPVMIEHGSSSPISKQKLENFAFGFYKTEKEDIFDTVSKTVSSTKTDKDEQQCNEIVHHLETENSEFQANNNIILCDADNNKDKVPSKPKRTAPEVKIVAFEERHEKNGLDVPVCSLKGQVQQRCAQLVSLGAPPLTGRSASLFNLSLQKKVVGEVAAVQEESKDTTDVLKRTQSDQNLTQEQLSIAEEKKTDFIQEQKRLHDEYLKLQAQFIAWQKQLLNNQSLLQNEQIMPKMSFPTFQDLQPQLQIEAEAPKVNHIATANQHFNVEAKKPLREELKTRSLPRPKPRPLHITENQIISNEIDKRPLTSMSQTTVSETSSSRADQKNELILQSKTQLSVAEKSNMYVPTDKNIETIPLHQNEISLISTDKCTDDIKSQTLPRPKPRPTSVNVSSRTMTLNRHTRPKSQVVSITIGSWQQRNQTAPDIDSGSVASTRSKFLSLENIPQEPSKPSVAPVVMEKKRPAPLPVESKKHFSDQKTQNVVIEKTRNVEKLPKPHKAVKKSLYSESDKVSSMKPLVRLSSMKDEMHPPGLRGCRKWPLPEVNEKEHSATRVLDSFREELRANSRRPAGGVRERVQRAEVDLRQQISSKNESVLTDSKLKGAAKQSSKLHITKVNIYNDNTSKASNHGSLRTENSDLNSDFASKALTLASALKHISKNQNTVHKLKVANSDLKSASANKDTSVNNSTKCDNLETRTVPTSLPVQPLGDIQRQSSRLPGNNVETPNQNATSINGAGTSNISLLPPPPPPSMPTIPPAAPIPTSSQLIMGKHSTLKNNEKKKSHSMKHNEDPREELMLEIRGFGGRQALRKHSRCTLFKKSHKKASKEGASTCTPKEV